MKIIRELQFLPVLLLSLWLSSCGTSDSAKEEATNSTDASEETLELKRNQINIGLAQRSAWQGHWSKVLGSFDASSFDWVTSDSIDPLEMPEKNPILPDDPLFPYQLPHPEDNGRMDIYSYKVEAQDGLEKPFLNPDSEVIWYRQDGMKERLLFMGPSGMFEDGMWLNPSEFIVFGYFQEEEGFRPMIWIIDVMNHKFFQFRMNKTSPSYESDSYLNSKLVFVDLS